MMSLKDKIKMCAIISGDGNLENFSRFLGISHSFLSLLVNGKTKCRGKMANLIIEKTKKFGQYAITIEDLLNNKNINIKNSASEVVSSDLTADDGG